MDGGLLISILISGAAAGAGCGVTCSACSSPMVNLFMASYIFTHGRKMRNTLLSLLKYYAGKTLGIVILCLAASFAGSRLIDEYGMIGSVNARLIIQIMLIVIMAVQIIIWFVREHRAVQKEGCENCRNRNFEKYPMYIYGFLGGITPCTPLFLILTYTAGVTPWMAALTGAAFAIANSLIPVLILSLLTGALSEKMIKEIPGKVKYIQIAAYIVFFVIAGIGAVRMAA